MSRANPKITDWKGKRVWLIGASSGIGAALAQQLADSGAVLALSARRAEPLHKLLPKEPNGSLVLPLDVTDKATIDQATTQLLTEWSEVDLVVWLAGTYQPMRASTFDYERAKLTVDANIMGPINGLSSLLPAMLTKRCAGVAFVSSVAGYRGLPRSLIYGPTKAALTNLAESLYLDFHPRGIGIWVINPGFVETPLTEKNDFKMPALLTPKEAAAAIVDGFASGRFEIHFPKRFTRFLKLLRTLPYWLYFAAIKRATNT
jgi:NADP-dependent 3-hydroxy acid dehydrogenase YdfG